MAEPSLMASHWVGLNSGPIFHHLRTKVHGIKFDCGAVSIVCNDIFRLTMDDDLLRSEDVCNQDRKVLRKLMFLDRQISGEGSTQISDQTL